MKLLQVETFLDGGGSMNPPEFVTFKTSISKKGNIVILSYYFDPPPPRNENPNGVSVKSPQLPPLILNRPYGAKPQDSLNLPPALPIRTRTPSSSSSRVSTYR